MVFNISRERNERRAHICFFKKLVDAVPRFKTEIENAISQIEYDENCDVSDLERKCEAMFEWRSPFEGTPKQLFCKEWTFAQDGVDVQLVKVDFSKRGITIPCYTGW